MKQALIFLVLFVLVLPSSICAQSFLDRNGERIVNEEGDTITLRGMGLGGWMLQEGYMFQMAEFAGAQWQIEEHIEDLVGTERKEAFYEAWYENHVTRKDIEAMAEWGFNLVRLPMHYNLFTLSIQEEPIEDEHTWLEKGFVMTDSLVSWCRDNDMYILLDLHAAPGGQGYNQGISDYNPIYPSLWEDNANKRKTIALWKQLAERYADEPVIAGYDLLNEPNWDLPGNAALRALYGEITDAIREVDERHLIFIEGNWFANDFTALTFPWDDRLVYAPHKYWSNNEKEDLRWMLDIRESTGHPVFFGESGENSNTWFRDAIRNFEDNGMGWAWWPEKKVEDIAGPLSIAKTPDYIKLLDYWKGSGPKPTEEEATETLMQFAENLKIENCFFQKDVIDAMFRQVYSDETVPFNLQTIPGVVYASDFDMGRNGIAYYDTEAGNYELSTGEFTPWNSGWSYRNDGVDVERSTDDVNSNGYNVGFMEGGEWMQYTVDVMEEGVYEVKIRYAAGTGNGRFHLATDNGILMEEKRLASTLGWSNWRTYELDNIVLTENDNKLIFHVDQSGFNLSSMEFIKVGEIADVDTRYLCAETLDEHTIVVTTNKPLRDTDNITSDDFTVTVNGNPFTISSVMVEENSKSFLVTVENTFSSSHTINISYDGTAISAMDDSVLSPFNQRVVKNTLSDFLPIPGRIEAEDYTTQSGIQLEATTDAGGGQNIGYLDVGDYADYFVDVRVGGTYKVDYRTASEGSIGEIELFLVDGDDLESLHQVSFASTGGWQNWTTTSKELELSEGKHQLRLVINRPMFNLNWMRFGSLTDTEDVHANANLSVFPNPCSDQLHLSVVQDKAQKITVELSTLNGQLLHREFSADLADLESNIVMSGFEAGVYLLTVRSESGWTSTEKIVKL